MGSKKPVLFAHRGGNAAGPQKENTLAAFKSAHKLGYTHIETDVVVTKDRKVVTYHGARNKKQSEATGFPTRGYVQSLNYAEILQFVRPGGEDVPVLSDVFRAFPKSVFSIDAKTDEVIEPLSEVIRATKSIKRVNITSFSLKRVLRLAELLGGPNKIATSLCIYPKAAVILSIYPGRYFKHLASRGITGIHYPYKHLNKRVIKAAQNSGISVFAWTVNSRHEAQRCALLGVDGIITDETAKLAQLDM